MFIVEGVHNITSLAFPSPCLMMFSGGSSLEVCGSLSQLSSSKSLLNHSNKALSCNLFRKMIGIVANPAVLGASVASGCQCLLPGDSPKLR